MTGGVATFATNQQGTGTNCRATSDSRGSSGVLDIVTVGGAGGVPRVRRVARPAKLQHVPHAEWIESGEQHVRHRVVHSAVDAQQHHRQVRREQQRADDDGGYASSYRVPADVDGEPRGQRCSGAMMRQMKHVGAESHVSVSQRQEERQEHGSEASFGEKREHRPE
eukprot:6182991-Pleurochrysis_carterae.AAC.1